MTDRLVRTMPAERTSASIPDESSTTEDRWAGDVKSRARHHWLQQQHQVLQTAWQRVEKSQGMEAIHEVRVAARRLRTVLKAWRKEIHPLSYAELRFELRDIGRLLAPTREADVRRRLIARLLRSVPEELSPARNQLLAHLDATRAAERHMLRTQMLSNRWRTTMTRIQAGIDSEQLLAVPRATADFAAERQKFAKDLRKLIKSCAKKKLPMAQLHALRIEGKRTRYVGEALSELSGQDLTASLKFLRQLQDLLGDLHDCLQLGEWCRQCHIDPALTALLEARLVELHKIRYSRFDELRTTKRET